jgi:hypothetical protein
MQIGLFIPQVQERFHHLGHQPNCEPIRAIVRAASCSVRVYLSCNVSQPQRITARYPDRLPGDEACSR